MKHTVERFGIGGIEYRMVLSMILFIKKWTWLYWKCLIMFICYQKETLKTLREK